MKEDTFYKLINRKKVKLNQHNYTVNSAMLKFTLKTILCLYGPNLQCEKSPELDSQTFRAVVHP